MTTQTDPTIVFVRGAFSESSSWNGIINALLAQSYPVIAAANPLRGVKNDAALDTNRNDHEGARPE